MLAFQSTTFHFPGAHFPGATLDFSLEQRDLVSSSVGVIKMDSPGAGNFSTLVPLVVPTTIGGVAVANNVGSLLGFFGLALCQFLLKSLI